MAFHINLDENIFPGVSEQPIQWMQRYQLALGKNRNGALRSGQIDTRYASR